MPLLSLVRLTGSYPLQVVSVNTEAKTVTFNDGTSQHYDHLLISTGARSGPFIVSVCYLFSSGNGNLQLSSHPVELEPCSVQVLRWRM